MQNNKPTQSYKLLYHKVSTLLLSVMLALPLFAGAEALKFEIKNTAKTNVAVYCRISRKKGGLKLKSLFSLKPGEERKKSISLDKDDTVEFYGQNAEEQTSVTIKRTFALLKHGSNSHNYIPIIIPQKESSNFQSLQGLSVKLEQNKVLNFLLKMDSTSMSSLSMLENNFQNIYPLGTFVFVDTKTNRLLLPPLEPSFWNSNETYLTIQDSLYALVNTDKRGMANAQVAYFVTRMFDSLRVNNTAELEFKAKLSLVRWKPTATADIYQVFNDKAVQAFLQNCYAQITDPSQQYQRYRLYFLSSYERLDDLEIYGKQFYNFGNQADLSVSSPAEVFSTSLGVMYTKSKTLSNYYSVQGAVLRTRAYDFTAQLFNSFQGNVKSKILADNYADRQRLSDAIIDEYKSLVAYNPNPVEMTLQPIDAKDNHPSIVSIETTTRNLTPYTNEPADTSKAPAAAANNVKISTYNNKVKIYNSHLQQINVLVKQLDQTENDIDRLAKAAPDRSFSGSVSSPGLLKEIEVNSQIVRKE